MNPQLFNLMLTLDEVNLVINALANLPYAQVQAVIPKVQQQCQAQINGPAEAKVPVPVVPTETAVSSEALVDVNKP